MNFHQLFEAPSTLDVLKEGIYFQNHLTEKLVKADPQELVKLKQEADSDTELYGLLFNNLVSSRYKYLLDTNSSKIVQYLFKLLEIVILNNLGESFFIKDSNNNFIGFISFYESKEDPTIIESVKVLNFNKKDEENNTFHDTLTVMNGLRKRYKEIKFSASKDNTKVVKVYDSYCKKHLGKKTVVGNEIEYSIPGVISLD